MAWGTHLHDGWRRMWVAAPADGEVQVLWVKKGRAASIGAEMAREAGPKRTVPRQRFNGRTHTAC